VLASAASADVVPAPPFRDNAVLQRDKPLPVWGRADPGEKVSVSFRSQKRDTVADEHGRWSVTLDPMPASMDPADLVLKGNNTVTVANVLVGEVWLCSGQSNMAWTVRQSANPDADAEAVAANYLLIRHFSIPRTSSALPCDDVAGEWAVCSPETVGAFSAVAYYFARELFRELNVPIGLINSSWGGTMIEAWMSPAALSADPSWPEVVKRWQETLVTYPERLAKHRSQLNAWTKEQATAKKANQPFKKARPRAPEGAMGSRVHPSAIYNAMIVPLIPCAIRGVIWYQGEANASRYGEYRTLFPSMIRQWREDFKQGDIPFYYVQLAAFDNNAPWAFQREAQQCALNLAATGEAVAIDIGEAKNIHPKNKQDVGRRLALNALAGAYGRDVEYSGPRFAGVANENGKLRIRLTHAAGLRAKGSGLPGFEIAGADRKFTPARAVIEGETVVVYSDAIKNPVAVRYAWASYPEATLYNASGLPASPFRSDDWEK
jgi:sialate O-acetylesterase